MANYRNVRIIVNLVCVIIFFVLSHFANKSLGLIPTQYRRGFFCDDTSIRYRKLPSLVSGLAIYYCSLLLPLFLILILEAVVFCYLINRKPNLLPPKNYIFDREIPQWIWNLFAIYLIYLFGFALNNYLTTIAKATIGRLRPHFIHVCKPMVDWSQCRIDPFTFFVNYTCNSTRFRPNDPWQSFPSGHASISSFFTLFVAIYLHYRFIFKTGLLLKFALQCAFVLFGIYSGLSRVADNNHHWTDVLAGFIIGVGSAILIWYIFILPLKGIRVKMDTPSPKKKTEESPLKIIII